LRLMIFPTLTQLIQVTTGLTTDNG
jgi:hypothetical protein